MDRKISWIVLLALCALMLLLPSAAARPFVPGRGPWSNPVCSTPIDPGTTYCVESRGGWPDSRPVSCFGVTQTGEPMPDGRTMESYHMVCHDTQDPTNNAVCTGMSFDGPGWGPYSYAYSCTGYWDGCTEWSESGYRYYNPATQEWENVVTGRDPNYVGNNCPFVD